MRSWALGIEHGFAAHASIAPTQEVALHGRYGSWTLRAWGATRFQSLPEDWDHQRYGFDLTAGLGPKWTLFGGVSGQWGLRNALSEMWRAGIRHRVLPQLSWKLDADLIAGDANTFWAEWRTNDRVRVVLDWEF